MNTISNTASTFPQCWNKQYSKDEEWKHNNLENVSRINLCQFLLECKKTEFLNSFLNLKLYLTSQLFLIYLVFTENNWIKKLILSKDIETGLLYLVGSSKKAWKRGIEFSPCCLIWTEKVERIMYILICFAFLGQKDIVHYLVTSRFKWRVYFLKQSNRNIDN